MEIIGNKAYLDTKEIELTGYQSPIIIGQQFEALLIVVEAEIYQIKQENGADYQELDGKQKIELLQRNAQVMSRSRLLSRIAIEGSRLIAALHSDEVVRGFEGLLTEDSKQ